MRPTTRVALVVTPFIVLAGAIVSRVRLQHDFEPLFALRHPIPVALWDELRAAALLHPAAPTPA